MSLTLGVTLPAAGSAQGKGVTKRQRTEAEDVEENCNITDTMLRKLTIHTAKLTLQGAQTNRQMKSMLADQFLLPADHILITEITKQTKSWSEAAKHVEAAKRMDEIGLPYHHAWNALVTTLFSMEGLTEKEKKIIEEYAAENKTLQKDHPEVYKNVYWTLETQVRLCKVNKTHDKTKKRLEVGVTAGTPAAKMWPFMASFLGRTKTISRRNGQAPPTEMEMQIQGILDKIKG
eukprot:TRINITY_DN33981_c0_g1_i1.p2 TRINITY_DN33981_c0_g1~~TRINITY_DN33981_c0_g1_i1.p2  ORF type:complete len:233 (+),score=70.25 TRINITY_DN33981_c0_g1_i1:324-1022(+)